MRSLPVLLIALALLPLSSALKCYAHVSGSGLPAATQAVFDRPSTTNEVLCGAGSEYCVAMDFRDDKAHAEVHIKTCETLDVICKREGCDDIKDKEEVMEGKKFSLTGKVCCCKGDHCNKPASDKSIGNSKGSKSGGSNPATAPTALLSLAAVAAVLAAHL